jgi:ABC-2 type transport system permease protein
MKDRLELLYAQKSSAKDTASRLDYKIKDLELSLKNIESRNYYGARTKENITKELELYKAYKDAGVIPNDERLTALRFIKEFPVNMNPLFVIIFVVLLAGDAVSTEHSGSTFRSYLSQPVTRGKVILSKYIGTILVSIFTFITIELIIFAYTGLTKGWGPLNTPVEFGAKFIQTGKTIRYITGSQSFIPGYMFVIYSLLLQSLYIAAAASIGFLISCIFKKPVTSISFSVCVMFTIYTIVQKIKALPAIHKYIFSYYSDISLLITQSFQYNISDLTLNIKNGIIVMSATCLICFFISYLIFRRQEIYS